MPIKSKYRVKHLFELPEPHGQPVLLSDGVFYLQPVLFLEVMYRCLQIVLVNSCQATFKIPQFSQSPLDSKDICPSISRLNLRKAPSKRAKASIKNSYGCPYSNPAVQILDIPAVHADTAMACS